MASRRKGRTIALQILYQADWTRDMTPDDAAELTKQTLQEYKKDLAPNGAHNDQELIGFVELLVSGVLARRRQIDSIISRFSKSWKLERMAAVDRNILRLGIFELCYLDEIPPKVAINEAVELAKKFGDANSAGFVNGILDSVYREVCKEKQQ